MPELSDNVRIYFPGNREDEGIAISSVSKAPPQSSSMLAATNPLVQKAVLVAEAEAVGQDLHHQKIVAKTQRGWLIQMSKH